jgi:hypothetical protein
MISSKRNNGKSDSYDSLAETRRNDSGWHLFKRALEKQASNRLHSPDTPDM